VLHFVAFIGYSWKCWCIISDVSQYLVRFQYCRYRKCCDDIVSISTIDFPYTSTCTYDVDFVDIDNVGVDIDKLTSDTLLCVRTVSISSISTMLWQYRMEIDNWISTHLYMYKQCRYRRYRHCCDDIVSISTIDLLYITVCTYCVDIDNVVTILYRYRQLTFLTLLYVHTVSISLISTILWRYRVDIDNWIHINLFMYLQLMLKN
jgi:hypothetical protein